MVHSWTQVFQGEASVQQSNKGFWGEVEVYWLQGLYGIQEEVFVSMPCAVGRNGVLDIIKLRLTPDEATKMKASAMAMFEVQKKLKL